MNKKIPVVTLLIFQFLNFPAFAQSSGSSGGGHDGLFKGIRDEIKVWISRNQGIGKIEEKLMLRNISGNELKSKYDAAVEAVGEKIVFNHDEIFFVDENGKKNVRVCKNEKITITCNIDEWEKLADGRLKYMIVFHEFLGVAQIETNQNTPYSSYPVSPRILRFVRATSSFELGLDAAAPIGDTGREYDSNFVLECSSPKGGERLLVLKKDPNADNSKVIEFSMSFSPAVEMLKISSSRAKGEPLWRTFRSSVGMLGVGKYVIEAENESPKGRGIWSRGGSRIRLVIDPIRLYNSKDDRANFGSTTARLSYVSEESWINRLIKKNTSLVCIVNFVAIEDVNEEGKE